MFNVSSLSVWLPSHDIAYMYVWATEIAYLFIFCINHIDLSEY